MFVLSFFHSPIPCSDCHFLGGKITCLNRCYCHLTIMLHKISFVIIIQTNCFNKACFSATKRAFLQFFHAIHSNPISDRNDCSNQNPNNEAFLYLPYFQTVFCIQDTMLVHSSFLLSSATAFLMLRLLRNKPQYHFPNNCYLVSGKMLYYALSFLFSH